MKVNSRSKKRNTRNLNTTIELLLIDGKILEIYNIVKQSTGYIVYTSCKLVVSHPHLVYSNNCAVCTLLTIEFQAMETKRRRMNKFLFTAPKIYSINFLLKYVYCFVCIYIFSRRWHLFCHVHEVIFIILFLSSARVVFSIFNLNF